MRVAAIQMTSTPDKQHNLREAHHFLLAALEKDVRLVAFPENFSLLTASSREYLEGSETLRGVTVESLQEWAAEYDIWILAGSIPLKIKNDAKRVTNTSLLISPEGEIKARYDKIHLFDAFIKGDQKYKESSHIQAGRRVINGEVDEIPVGLSICYDLRFPELYRAQSEKGAEILFVPSAFTPLTGQAHWDILTRARAVENQAYLVAPAQTGSPYPGRTTYGHTRIVDTWGRVIAERPRGPGVVWADLNFEELNRIRTELPALTHRKL